MRKEFFMKRERNYASGLLMLHLLKMESSMESGKICNNR